MSPDNPNVTPPTSGDLPPYTPPEEEGIKPQTEQPDLDGTTGTLHVGGDRQSGDDVNGIPPEDTGTDTPTTSPTITVPGGELWPSPTPTTTTPPSNTTTPPTK